MSTPPVDVSTCRHCRAAVHVILCGGQSEWVHTGAGAGFACRDDARNVLNSYAEPTAPEPSAPEPAVPAEVLVGLVVGERAGRAPSPGPIDHGRHRAEDRPAWPIVEYRRVSA